MFNDKHTLLLVFGDRANSHNGTSAELLEHLQKQKDVYGQDFKNMFFTSLRSFATKDEKAAFLDGLEISSDHDDIAVVEENFHRKEILSLFDKKEDYSDIRKPFSTQVKDIRDHLEEITESGWIPFSSPAPSTTESALKREIYTALMHLGNAVIFAK